jgi:hypothetical protein
VALELAFRELGLDTLPAIQPNNGMATRTRVSHLQLNANFGPGPATARRDQIAQSRGDQDQAPIKMAIHIFKENNRSGVHRMGPTTPRDIRTARADGKTAAQDEWP